MVAKKDRKDLYPKNYTGDNNWLSNPQKYKGGNKYLISAIIPKKDMSAWCAERKAKGYGPKCKVFQNRTIHSIEDVSDLKKEESSE